MKRIHTISVAIFVILYILYSASGCKKEESKACQPPEQRNNNLIETSRVFGKPDEQHDLLGIIPSGDGNLYYAGLFNEKPIDHYTVSVGPQEPDQDTLPQNTSIQIGKMGPEMNIIWAKSIDFLPNLILPIKSNNPVFNNSVLITHFHDVLIYSKDGLKIIEKKLLINDALIWMNDVALYSESNSVLSFLCVGSIFHINDNKSEKFLGKIHINKMTYEVTYEAIRTDLDMGFKIRISPTNPRKIVIAAFNKIYVLNEQFEDEIEFSVVPFIPGISWFPYEKPNDIQADESGIFFTIRAIVLHPNGMVSNEHYIRGIAMRFDYEGKLIWTSSPRQSDKVDDYYNGFIIYNEDIYVTGSEQAGCPEAMQCECDLYASITKIDKNTGQTKNKYTYSINKNNLNAYKTCAYLGDKLYVQGWTDNISTDKSWQAWLATFDLSKL